ncbi:MAG: NRDE family protein [Woeseiaceae bacterium]
MCLILFAWRIDPEYPLVLAANRDEFHQRPTQSLHKWTDEPTVVAGRDLQAGGTWLGAGPSGRVAAVTNYREDNPQQRRRQSQGQRSRGELVADFLLGSDAPEDFSKSIDYSRYAGFSLLSIDADDICYVSNRGDAAMLLAPGIYGLSNASLDTPWPKLLRTRETFGSIVAAGGANETSLMRVLADRQMSSAAAVEQGALPFALARAVTAPFIVTPEYGTRCTTVVLRNRAGQTSISERRFDAGGRTVGESRHSIAAN